MVQEFNLEFDGEEEYAVEKIKGLKLSGLDEALWVRIKWYGGGFTWEPIFNCQNCMEKIECFTVRFYSYYSALYTVEYSTECLLKSLRDKTNHFEQD